MKKRILSIVLAICLVLTLVPTTAFAGSGSHTVTVNAGENGKVSTDGTSWSNSVKIAVNDGETLNGKVQYKADEGYGLDDVVPKISSVAVCENHTVLLDANGNVWTAGWNKYGQLGRAENAGTDTANPTFTQVTVGNGVKIKAIAAGGNHTVLLDEEGNVWTAGYNYYGQLGRDENKGTFEANPTFTKVTDGIGGVKITAIAAGYFYTVLLDEDGNVWTAGQNKYGQLGRDENEGTTNNANPTFTQVTGGIGGVKITAIAAGAYHNVLLDEEGNVWTAGYNYYGQLGRNENSGTENPNPTFTKVTGGIGGVKITSIAAGGNHTVLLDESNNVWTAGLNKYGQLGRDENKGTLNANPTFTQVTDGISAVTITAIAAGAYHTVLTDENNNVWTAGENSYGQLGRGGDTSTFTKVINGIGGVRITAIAAGAGHTVLLDENGNVWTAGYNCYGQLGRETSPDRDSTFAQPTVNPDAITFDELINIPIHNNSVFIVKFKDVQKPVITGLENNKTYCDTVEFTVTDNDGIASVKAGSAELTPNTYGNYTLTAGIGAVTVVATDNSGNIAEVTVTVNNGHTDANRDHVCDYGCNVAIGEHIDENKDHVCDYGCTVAIGEHTGGEATCVAKAICEYCAKEYGELDSTNHNFEKIPAKDATVTETGNTEYWHCLDCDKCFADENGTIEITLDDTVISKLPPEIIEGEGQSITEGELKELIFRSNAAFSDFICVELDGEILDTENYTATEGSTIITLKADYVANLSAGEHTIGIVSESGTASTTFTVNEKAVEEEKEMKSPETGNDGATALWLAFLLSCGGAIIVTGAYGKRKKQSR